MAESEEVVEQIFAVQELRRNLALTLNWKYGPEKVKAGANEVLPFAEV